MPALRRRPVRSTRREPVGRWIKQFQLVLDVRHALAVRRVGSYLVDLSGRHRGFMHRLCTFQPIFNICMFGLEDSNSGVGGVGQ
jgi:hypothetical protein